MSNPQVMVTFPNKILREKSKPVLNFKGLHVDQKIDQLINRMFERINRFQGIGLSAVQIGFPLRVMLVGNIANIGDKIDFSLKSNFAVCINPEILQISKTTSKVKEGCLSIPSVSANVIRPETIDVRYLSVHGNVIEKTLTGTLARIFQHEYDHLEGTLFIDHLAAVKRSMIMTKYNKDRERQSKRYSFPQEKVSA